MSKIFTEEEYFNFEPEVTPNEVLESSNEGVGSQLAEYEKGDFLNVERSFSGSWSGVRGCGSRAQAEFDKAFHARLQSVINEFSHLTYMSSSATGSYRTRNGRRINQSRWCRGWLTNCKLVAIFRVP